MAEYTYMCTTGVWGLRGFDSYILGHRQRVLSSPQAKLEGEIGGGINPPTWNFMAKVLGNNSPIF